MKAFWQGFEKRAFFGVGMRVWSSKNQRHHATVGFPYLVGYDYSLKDEPGWGPTVGVGLTGPHIGTIHRDPSPTLKNKPKPQNEAMKAEEEKQELAEQAYLRGVIKKQRLEKHLHVLDHPKAQSEKPSALMAEIIRRHGRPHVAIKSNIGGGHFSRPYDPNYDNKYWESIGGSVGKSRRLSSVKGPYDDQDLVAHLASLEERHGVDIPEEKIPQGAIDAFMAHGPEGITFNPDKIGFTWRKT